MERHVTTIDRRTPIEAKVTTMDADDLQRWANIFQIVGGIGVVLAVLALVVARSQLIKTKKATRGQMTLAVDQALAPYDDIRHAANSENWQPPPLSDATRSELRHRIKEYMGVWERVQHLLVDDSIEETTVNKLYTGRVKNLLRHEVVRSYVIDKPADLEDFLAFARRLGKQSPEIKEWVAEIERNSAAKLIGEHNR